MVYAFESHYISLLTLYHSRTAALWYMLLNRIMSACWHYTIAA